MSDGQAKYRKAPLALFEHGTRIYAPCPSEDCYRVLTRDDNGKRLSFKFVRENDARAKARQLESYLSSNTPLRGRDGGRTVGALAGLYVEHLAGKSVRYRERQEALLRRWVLPRLGTHSVEEWSPAISEEILDGARKGHAPHTVQSLGSCMRSMVTFAHKSRWLPRDVDPMWRVKYSAKAEYQGEAAGFVPRDSLPSDEQCSELFEAFAALGQPVWELAMRLKHRCGARWGELIALRPCDIEFEPRHVVHIHRAVEQSAKAIAIKPTKNRQKRTSIFPESLTEQLADHVDRIRRDFGNEAFLFAFSHDGPATRRRFLRIWHRAALAAGWPMHSNRRSAWHPHDLRHVAACWMLFDVGLDTAHVARLLGHANAAFTLSRYVGVRSGADSAAETLMARW